MDEARQDFDNEVSSRHGWTEKVRRKKFYGGFLDEKLTYGDQLLENSAKNLVINNRCKILMTNSGSIWGG